MTTGWLGRSEALEVVVIARRENEEVIGFLTNDVTWRRSCRYDHTTTLTDVANGAPIGRWFRA
jgi:hypothetical protein